MLRHLMQMSTEQPEVPRWSVL